MFSSAIARPSTKGLDGLGPGGTLFLLLKVVPEDLQLMGMLFHLFQHYYYCYDSSYLCARSVSFKRG